MRSWSQIPMPACLVALACVAIACGPSTPTEVIVLLDAQPGARSIASSLHVRVIGTDGSTRLVDSRPIDATTAWPLRLPLVPEGGDASRRWAVEATLTDAGGATIAIARARGGYVAGALREAGLCLFDGCASEACGASAGCEDATRACTTCRGGGCADATASLDAPGATPRCPPSECTPRGPTESACGDGEDDDCDGAVDCGDRDCACDAGSCVPRGPEDTLAACHDGADNDCDGLIDCGEGAACRLPEGPEACDDGIDGDCDGLIDCLDLGCCAAPSCDQRACGANGLRCCDGACVDTWDDERHCGACRTPCDPARLCLRVPDGDGSGSAMGSACRCGVGDGECARGTCESHDGVAHCNCAGDGECVGAAVCRSQGAMHHSFCAYP